MKSAFVLSLLVATVLSASINPINYSTISQYTVTTQYPTADLSLLNTNGASTSTSTTNQNVFNAIKNAQSSVASSYANIQSLFSRLPSSAELDLLVAAGDSVAILKAIQGVISDSSIPCDQALNYLLDLSGKIKCAIEKKTFSANQLQVIIDGANAEIARLQGEIARLNAQKDSYGINDLNNKVAQLVSILNDLYNQFNNLDSQLGPKQAQITGYNNMISILEKSSTEERNRITNNNLQLVEVQALIRNLQSQLAAAQDNQTSLMTSIAKSNQIIANNDANITSIRGTIAALQNEIKSIQDKLDNMRRNITEYEIQAERARTNIAIAQASIESINKQIQADQDAIANEQKKLVNGDLQGLKTQINSLTNSLNSVTDAINRAYYYCYGDGAVKTVQANSTIVYVVRGEAFANYIQSAYGQTVTLNKAGNVSMQTVDPFSPQWTSKFGKPFDSSSFGQGSASSFAGDFSCMSNTQTTSGSCQITGISSSYISCSGSGSPKQLKIGACSRLEATSSLPQVGMTIAWKGVPSAAGGYSVYAASMW